MAYVSYPQAVFMILQRIGQTPLQQVKSVKTGGAPTGAKAGLLATVLFVAGAAYKEIPGVKEAIGNVGTFANDTIRNFTGSLDQALGGTLSSLSFNPTANQLELIKGGFTDIQTLAAQAAIDRPGLDVAGLVQSVSTSASNAVDNFLGHTNNLSGLSSVSDYATGAVDQNLLKSAVDSADGIRTGLTETLTTEATQNGLTGSALTKFVNDGIASANEQMLNLTNGKMGLVSEGFYQSLKGGEVTALKLAVLAAKDVIANPEATQAMINAAKDKVTNAVDALNQKRLDEQLAIQNQVKATALLGTLTQTASDFADPKYAGIHDLTITPSAKTLLTSTNEGIAALNAAQNPVTAATIPDLRA